MHKIIKVMNKKFFFLLFFNISLSCLLTFVGCSTSGEEPSAKQAIKAMKKATQYFRKDVATNGGYLWRYKTDFTLRQGEEVASPTTIWVQPPGTPSIGMAFLEAYKVTGDTMFLNVAISTARALAWGQLASGGWDYRIDFDPAEGKKWYYRRDIESGDTIPNRRRNRSSLDDDNTQSALQFLMQLIKSLISRILKFTIQLFMDWMHLLKFNTLTVHGLSHSLLLPIQQNIRLKKHNTRKPGRVNIRGYPMEIIIPSMITPWPMILKP